MRFRLAVVAGLVSFVVGLSVLSTAQATSPRNVPLVPKCLLEATRHYQVDWRIMMALRQVEGGWNGLESPNDNGTFDLGRMQINTIWLKNKDLVDRGITRAEIRDNECVNYWVATWIYRKALDRSAGNAWTAAGNYHSATPVFHNRYLSKVRSVFAQQERDRAAFFKLPQDEQQRLLKVAAELGDQPARGKNYRAGQKPSKAKKAVVAAPVISQPKTPRSPLLKTTLRGDPQINVPENPRMFAFGGIHAAAISATSQPDLVAAVTSARVSLSTPVLTPVKATAAVKEFQGPAAPAAVEQRPQVVNAPAPRVRAQEPRVTVALAAGTAIDPVDMNVSLKMAALDARIRALTSAD